MATAHTPSLVLDKLSCRRAGRMVFRDLDFQLNAGQAAALRGANGVGKSTLLRLLAGLLPVAAGDAWLDNLSLAGRHQEFQELVTYAGHQNAVKPALSVAENLALWAGVHGNPPGRAQVALRRFGLDQIAERPAAQCSAGQQRRLGLARLLVADRPLWLLDEPTVSLDADAAALVASLVGEHIEAGGMALIATHVDLGLGDIPVLEMTAVSVDTSDQGDPFLAGSWQ